MPPPRRHRLLRRLQLLRHVLPLALDQRLQHCDHLGEPRRDLVREHVAQRVVRNRLVNASPRRRPLLEFDVRPSCARISGMCPPAASPRGTRTPAVPRSAARSRSARSSAPATPRSAPSECGSAPGTTPSVRARCSPAAPSAAARASRTSTSPMNSATFIRMGSSLSRRSPSDRMLHSALPNATIPQVLRL